MPQGRHWTLDNAPNNGTFIQELGVILQLHNINFNPHDRCIMCFSHVINICCQHMINNLTNTVVVDGTQGTHLKNPAQSYKDAVKHDLIACGQNIVHVLCSSGQQQETFQEVIQDSNARGWFRVGDQLCSLQLLWDVRTRWDSVYFIVKHLQELCPVCNYYFT